MTENNPNLSEQSIKTNLSELLLEDIDSIFIEDSTESTNEKSNNNNL